MGKLKNSIDNVVKTTGTLEKAAGALLEDRARMTQNFLMACDFCRGGADSIYMYLMAKFKKNGEKIDAHKDDTLKDVIDGNIAKMVKELVKGQSRVEKLKAAGDKNLKVGMAVKANAGKVRNEISSINAIVAKKKKKLLASKKYKTKLKEYEAALADIDSQLEALEKMLPGKGYGKYVDPKIWKVSASTKVSQIKDATSTSLTMDMKMLPKEDEEHAKKFRGRGFAKSLAQMKKWSSEADDMEKE